VADALLVLNAGSSSLKFALFSLGDEVADPARIRGGQVAGIGGEPRFEAHDAAGAHVHGARAANATDHDGALDVLLAWLDEGAGAMRLAGAGHRVVHGGAARSAPARVDAALMQTLGQLAPLAPQHQPHNLAAIEALRRRHPELPQVACFDTAFHATQPEVARRLALPAALAERGLIRYGFHGLSYEFIAGALPAYCGGAMPRRTVVAHLGNGASMCAMLDGQSVATTMGFSTLDGLPMGTRSGSVDPGALLYLLREAGYGVDDLTALLYERSGLLGVSGVSADMRTLLASDAPGARRAVDLFCYRAVRAVGSLAAALGGLDALVFTGGVGENAAPVRAAVCEGSAWLGLTLDADANAAGGPRITTPASAVSAWVIPTDEERVIARHTRHLLAHSESS